MVESVLIGEAEVKDVRRAAQPEVETQENASHAASLRSERGFR